MVHFFRMTAKIGTPNASPRILSHSFDCFPWPHHFLLFGCFQFLLHSPMLVFLYMENEEHPNFWDSFQVCHETQWPALYCVLPYKYFKSNFWPLQKGILHRGCGLKVFSFMSTSVTQKHPDSLQDLKYNSTLFTWFGYNILKSINLKYKKKLKNLYRFLSHELRKLCVLKRIKFRIKIFTYRHIYQAFGALNTLKRT